MSDPRITQEETRKVASLARLALSDDEVEGLSKDLARILDYVAKLEALDTAGVEPSSHATKIPTRTRSDAAEPSLPLDEALKNAPERIGDGFGVPKVIE